MRSKRKLKKVVPPIVDFKTEADYWASFMKKAAALPMTQLSRSVQRRIAMQKGKPMPSFATHTK